MAAFALCVVSFGAGLWLAAWLCHRDVVNQREAAIQAEAERDAALEVLCAAQLFMARDRVRWERVQRVMTGTPKRRTKDLVH